MTCAKWGTSIFALAILAVTIWPSLVSQETAKWIVIIASILIAVIVWTGTICKCDLVENKAKKK